MIDDDYTTKTGHTLDDLARDARTLLLVLFLKEPVEWMEVKQDIRVKWIEKVVEPIVFQVTHEISVSWVGLTSKAWGNFYGKAPDQFFAMSRYTQLVWQAVVRYLVNMVSCEDTDDIRSMGPNVETYWKEWLSDKLKEKESKSGEDSNPPEEDYED